MRPGHLMKTCCKCKQEKPKTDFANHRSSKDRRYPLCKICAAEATSQWRRENPERERGNKLRRDHNMTLAEYDELFNSQGGRCAICNTDTPLGRGRFHVDHNHHTGRIRGLLCHKCNLFIGLANDSIEILNVAIKYLSSSVPAGRFHD